MTITRLIAAALASSLVWMSAAHAAITGYLDIPDIQGESKSAAVGSNETTTIGANQTETIKGGQAVVVGALWNGGDNPPPRNAAGTVMVIISGEDMSDGLQRLQQERRVIPSMTLAVTENAKTSTYELRGAVISVYRTAEKSRVSHTPHYEAQIAYRSVNW